MLIFIETSTTTSSPLTVAVPPPTIASNAQASFNARMYVAPYPLMAPLCPPDLPPKLERLLSVFISEGPAPHSAAISELADDAPGPELVQHRDLRPPGARQYSQSWSDKANPFPRARPLSMPRHRRQPNEVCTIFMQVM